jgi:hypothetical protein
LGVTAPAWRRSKAEIACSSFAFDTVLGAEACQADLYRAAVAPVVGDVLNGYNGTIMAYGCTGGFCEARFLSDVRTWPACKSAEKSASQRCCAART